MEEMILDRGNRWFFSPLEKLWILPMRGGFVLGFGAFCLVLCLQLVFFLIFLMLNYFLGW